MKMRFSKSRSGLPNAFFFSSSDINIYAPRAILSKCKDESILRQIHDVMNKNKTPGNDGLTVEFYYTFWVEIKDVMIGAFSEAYICFWRTFCITKTSHYYFDSQEKEKIHNL